jgi:citronellyl-CoA dehydrogenase
MSSREESRSPAHDPSGLGRSWETIAMAFPRWSEEHAAFRETVRRFALEEIRPHAEQWQAEGYFPDELFQKAGELGLLGVRFDPRWGGSGLDYWYTVILVEELVRGRDTGCVVGLLVQCEMATAVMHDHGTDALRQEWLVPAIRGECIAALGVTEPGGGSDVASLQTTAKADGDDYVIRGSKIFISNGARADFVTLAVRTGGPGPGGVSLVVCPTDAKGFQVSRRLEKIDLKSSDTAELFFDDVRIPRRFLIGEEGRGFRYIMGAFQGERLVLAVMMNALCDDVLEETLGYLAERKAFGQPLATMQSWRHRMADWITRLEASRALTYRAAEQLATGDPEGELSVSMAKLYGAELIRGLVLDCAHAFGGYGFMEENYVARCTRGVQNWGIGAGTSEVMREIIARRRVPASSG